MHLKPKRLNKLPRILHILQQKKRTYTFDSAGQTNAEVYIDLTHFNSINYINIQTSDPYVECYAHIKYKTLYKKISHTGYQVRFSPLDERNTIFQILTYQYNISSGSDILDVIRKITIINHNGELQDIDDRADIETILRSQGNYAPIIKVQFYIYPSYFFLQTMQPCPIQQINDIINSVLPHNTLVRLYHFRNEWMIETGLPVGHYPRPLTIYQKLKLVLHRSSIPGYWSQIYKISHHINAGYYDMVHHLRSAHQSVVFLTNQSSMIGIITELDKINIESIIVATIKEEHTWVELMTTYNFNNQSINDQIINILSNHHCETIWTPKWQDSRKLVHVDLLDKSKWDPDMLLYSPIIDLNDPGSPVRENVPDPTPLDQSVFVSEEKLS